MPKLSRSQLISLIYHDFFDYPLASSELTQWQASPKVKLTQPQSIKTDRAHDLYFLAKRENLIALRAKRQKSSLPKLKLAHRAVQALSCLPTLKFVGLTGSLAMNNARPSSDIDFLLITHQNTLWLTRLLAYLVLLASGFPLRRPHDRVERDKLCLNMWLDEADLVLSEQNIYTAHELAQIVPLLNRGEVHERLLASNRWIEDFWPSAVQLTQPQSSLEPSLIGRMLKPAEFLLFRAQLRYMRSKITSETVTPNRAFFHPHSCFPKLKAHLARYGIKA